MATTTLDRYRHISSLGTGGMATVVLAEDTVLGREVALKRMKITGDTRGLSRLRREALIGASVSHQNLVSIYDVVTLEDGDLVIVMEYVPGETLRDALFRETRLPPVTALRVLEGVSAGLDAIHRRGIVHRDVKPANILLGAGETVKLADLGVASIPDRTRITTDGALVGTFSYMAPEQLTGSAVTPAADVYALSAVAFEALCGRKAHPEPNPVALAHAVSTQPPPDLRNVWPGAPLAAADVLIRGMSKDPEKRPRSASELTGRLRAALDPYTTAPQDPLPDAPPRRQRSDPRARQALAAAGGAAASAAAPGTSTARATNMRGTDPAPAAAPVIAPAPDTRPHANGLGAPNQPRVADPPGRSGGPDTPAATRARGPKAPARASAAPTIAPSRAPARHRSRGGLIAAALLPLAVLAVALPILLSSGSASKSRTRPNTTAHRSGATNRDTTGSISSSVTSGSSSAGAVSGQASTSTSSSPPPSGVGGTASAASPGTPVSAVESFYSLAASHRYSQAWALADPTFRGQLGSYPAFAAQQSGDRSITFNSAKAVSQSPTAATVAVQTTSVRQNGTQHCSGTVDLARTGASAGWMLHLIHINCT